MGLKHVINEFKHKVGVHCESSAMRDMFEFVGFPMSEPMAFGLDGTIGFGYFGQSNQFTDASEENITFFLGGKQGTINPLSLSCRILGIDLRKQSFTSADKAWEESKILIDQNVPLIIQCDLAYLEYFEVEEEVHFGGHSIVLAGYDEEKSIAFVADTEFEGLQEVSIENLKKARSSEFGPSFLRPKNAQYSMNRKEKRPPLSAGVKLAIQESCKNMLRPSMSNNGIQGLKKFAKSIPKWKDDFKGTIIHPYTNKEINLALLMFNLAHGYIEEWGTGGSCFRKLYLEFLKELQEHPDMRSGPRPWNTGDFDNLDQAIPILEESVISWKEIADTLKQAVNDHQEECLDHINLEGLQQIMREIIDKEERIFTILSKIKN